MSILLIFFRVLSDPVACWLIVGLFSLICTTSRPGSLLNSCSLLKFYINIQPYSSQWQLLSSAWDFGPPVAMCIDKRLEWVVVVIPSYELWRSSHSPCLHTVYIRI